MTNESIAQKTHGYNPYRIDEVYQVIKLTFPHITNGKQMTAEVVTPFIRWSLHADLGQEHAGS